MIKIENKNAVVTGSMIEVIGDVVTLIDALLTVEPPYPLMAGIAFYLDEGNEAVTDEQREKLKKVLAAAGQVKLKGGLTN